MESHIVASVTPFSCLSLHCSVLSTRTARQHHSPKDLPSGKTVVPCAPIIFSSREHLSIGPPEDKSSLAGTEAGGSPEPSQSCNISYRTEAALPAHLLRDAMGRLAHRTHTAQLHRMLPPPSMLDGPGLDPTYVRHMSFPLSHISDPLFG